MSRGNDTNKGPQKSSLRCTDTTCASHYQHVQQLLEVGSWCLDFEQETFHCSQELRELLGQDVEETELAREDLHALIDPCDRDFVKRQWDDLREGESFELKYRLFIDEDPIWVQERATVEVDDDGKPVTATGVVQDVTDYKEREQELEFFRTMVDHASDGFYVIDRETSNILDVNETACEMLGYEREDLLSFSVLDINPEFSMDRWEEFIETVREHGSATIETTHRRKDGSTFPVEIQVSYVSLDQEYHIATVRDITDRKEREREVKAARKRYQTLISEAPNPIVVADAETGEIVETNAAAAELMNRPQQELVGLHQTELHPEDETDRYRALFEQYADESITLREFDDGAPLQIITSGGEQIPVSISIAPVSINGRTLVHGIFRETSVQQRYEEALRGVNQTAQQLLTTETDAEIATTVVEKATELLEATGSAVYLYEEQTGELAPAAVSDGTESLVGGLPRFSPGDSVAWRVFAEQELVHFDDVRTTEDVYNTGTPIRSEIIAPLDEHGVLIVGDISVGTFDDLAVEIAETLAATVEAALDRAQRSQRLREREREAKLQAQRLDRLQQLNDKIRAIIQTLMNARSREAITRQACESLVSTDQFDHVWIGEPDLTTDKLEVVAEAGSLGSYLESVPLELDSDIKQPALQVARDRHPISIDIASVDAREKEWRESALLHGLRSVVSVPIQYEGILYGVLTAYSATVESVEQTTTVLAELGECIGYALNAVDQRSALLSEHTVDLSIEATTSDDVLLELAANLSTELRIENIVLQAEDRYLIHVLVEDPDCEQICSAAEEHPAISEIRSLSSSTPGLYELVMVGDCLATTATDLGADLESITVDANRYLLSAYLPETSDTRTFATRLQEEYPEIDILAQEVTDSSVSASWRQLLSETLTERQQDILLMAYYSGYFNQPRDRTGAEIAEALGISQPAFSMQLRTAQSNLLQRLTGEEAAKRSPRNPVS